ncbi:hypothetical protein PIB30_061660 [Stylosanthes scabra]|uniref:Zinc transporter 11 n=1 Tax=Stylosanthes scabra TaxID=79078 RepID=A0ABU6SL19_9FABA|nr:hypothetical protein [Stylosanthes scabra]
MPSSSSSSQLIIFFVFFFLFILSASAHSGHDDDDADADGGDSVDLRSKSLILAKIYCLIVIFFATFIAGVSPYVLKWNEGFLVLGTQFAGGVFLGTAMMHFLSDANETFGDLTDKEYPFAFMLACVGYLITMLADCVISTLLKNHAPQSASDDPEIQGVAETKADAWKALWTISLHKVFAAIAMGIALLRMIPDRPLLSCAAYAFAFAISSPIGVAIGIIIDATAQGAVADWIFAISMGLACGVFVYVSINHLLSKGYAPHRPVVVDSAYFRFLAVLFGVGVIAVVMIWDT